MLIRVFNDLHYEFDAKLKQEFWTPMPLETDKDTTLILAGDLFNGLKAIPIICRFHQLFKTVLIVLGNHDMWGEDIQTFALDYEQELIFQGMDNVHLLDRTTFEQDGILFVGATLWTNMNNEDSLTVHAAKYTMFADFNQINNGTPTITDDYITRQPKFTPKDWLNRNKQDFDYIKTIVELNKDKKICVITHHGCTFASVHERFKNDTIANAYFVNDYADFILDNPQIKVWAHGHVHNNFNYLVGDTRVIVNPRAYPGENKEFDEVSVYEID